MKIEDLYLVGTSPYAFRQGQAALIIGIKSITPAGISQTPRVCYEVKFPDQTVDQIPCTEVEAGNYALVTFDSIMAAFGEKITEMQKKLDDWQRQPVEKAPELAKVININANIAAPRA